MIASQQRLVVALDALTSTIKELKLKQETASHRRTVNWRRNPRAVKVIGRTYRAMT